jgi:hypothetical protein
LRQATNQSEALELAYHTGCPALVMQSARVFSREGIIFRRFADDFLAAEAGLAYHAESDSSVLTCLRQFLTDTFQPLSGNQSTDAAGSQMSLFSSDAEFRTIRHSY